MATRLTESDLFFMVAWIDAYDGDECKDNARSAARIERWANEQIAKRQESTAKRQETAQVKALAVKMGVPVASVRAAWQRVKARQ